MKASSILILGGKLLWFIGGARIAGRGDAEPLHPQADGDAKAARFKKENP